MYDLMILHTVKEYVATKMMRGMAMLLSTAAKYSNIHTVKKSEYIISFV